MNKTVYKAVVKENGKFWSLCYCFSLWDLDPKSIALEYKIGETTLPKIKNSGIYTFSSLERAIDFVKFGIGEHPNNTFAILECEYQSFKDNGWSAVVYVCPKSIESIIKFWKGIKKDISIGSAASGTVVCKWVKPIRFCGTLKSDRHGNKWYYEKKI